MALIVRVRLMPSWRPLLRLAANLLIIAGASVVAVWVWALLDGMVYQHVQQTHFAEATGGVDLQFETRPQVFLVPPLLRPAALVKPDPLVLGKLEIPSVGLSVMVREGVDAASLRKAVGHLSSSALPGEAGNFVLLGHRDTFFRPLRNIARGDTIAMRTVQGSYAYVVESIQVVEPDFSLRADDRSAPVATLITCFPFGYTGPAPRRFVVRARLQVSSGLEKGQ
jgi:sortase A